MNLLLGSIVTSDSPSGSFSWRNLVNVIFTGLIASIPVFVNSLIVQVPGMNFGSYNWMLPVIMMILKGVAETYKEKEV